MYCGGYIDGVFSKCDHHGNGHLDCCPVPRALAAAKKLREGKVAVVSDPEMASYLSDWGEIVCRMSLDLGREMSFARRRKAMTVGETCLYCGGSGKTGSEARCQRTWDGTVVGMRVVPTSEGG